MRSLAALLSLSVFAVAAFAADGAGTQAPSPNTNTQSPGVQTPVSPSAPGTQPTSPNLQAPDGQTPSMENPGSTQSPSPTPGTEFPSTQNPTAPNQTGTAQGGTAQRTRQQTLTDIRAAITQIPSANQQGSMPGMESTGAQIKNLRVIRRGGAFVLSGTVATQAEKDAAGNRARQAAGGREIVNQLEVK